MNLHHFMHYIPSMMALQLLSTMDRKKELEETRSYIIQEYQLTKRKTESRLLSWQICNIAMVVWTKVIPTWSPVVKLTKIISPQSVPIMATWWHSNRLCHHTTDVGWERCIFVIPEFVGFACNNGEGKDVKSVEDHRWSNTAFGSTSESAGMMKIEPSLPGNWIRWSM
jgi:hypothetical protein